MINEYQNNAIKIEKVWSDNDEKIQADEIKKQEKIFDMKIEQSLLWSADDNAMTYCDGNIEKYHQLFSASLEALIEDNL